jgi:hypothetical protein
MSVNVKEPPKDTDFPLIVIEGLAILAFVTALSTIFAVSTALLEILVAIVQPPLELTLPVTDPVNSIFLAS